MKFKVRSFVPLLTPLVLLINGMSQQKVYIKSDHSSPYLDDRFINTLTAAFDPKSHHKVGFLVKARAIIPIANTKVPSQLLTG